jgi:hypothetical protein
MGATLVARARPGFSQSARWTVEPRRHAAGHARAHGRPGRRHGALAVGGRRCPDDVLERAAERAEAREADVEADLAHGPVGLAQERHRPLDPPALQVAVRRLAERRAEAADEVCAREVHRASQGLDVERIGVPAVHRVAGAQQATIHVVARFGGHHEPRYPGVIWPPCHARGLGTGARGWSQVPRTGGLAVRMVRRS